MTDEKESSQPEEKTVEVVPPIDWFPAPEGLSESYSNFVHLNWTLYI